MIPQEKAAAAVNTLLQNWYLPSFLTKLANDYGVQVQSPEQVNELLKMATILSTTEVTAAVAGKKMPDPVSQFLKHASDSLVTETTGVDPNVGQQEMLKQAQARICSHTNPQLREAALIYGFLATGGKPTS